MPNLPNIWLKSRLKTANKNLLATVLNFAESAPDALSLHEFALVLTVKAGIHYEEVVHYIVWIILKFTYVSKFELRKCDDVVAFRNRKEKT